MSVHSLDSARTAALQAAPLTCPEELSLVQATPQGFRRLTASVELTRRDFDGLVDDLFSWRVHERAGLRVYASDVPLRLGTVVLIRLGVGPLSLNAPCRVVDVIDEPHRRGFKYGTLPGHPEAGQEQFTLERNRDGVVGFTVAAIPKPASLLAQIGGPLTRATQDRVTRRYLRALDRI